MTKSTRTATLLLIAAFLLGAVAGAAALSLTGDHPFARGGHRSGPPTFLARLTRDLDLTPVQRDSVAAILDRYEPRMDSIWADIRPRFETVQEQLRSDISAQLTPEQQRKYADLLARFKARRSKDSTNAHP